jgi:hypothetical protein
MITRNGQIVVITITEDKKELKAAEKWAKSACDRIFSHYSEKEMDEMRKRNLR